jgi:hypothetical protein
MQSRQVIENMGGKMMPRSVIGREAVFAGWVGCSSGIHKYSAGSASRLEAVPGTASKGLASGFCRFEAALQSKF